MALFEVKNLTFGYPLTDKIIDGVSFSVEQGDFIAVCGPTGSGKTTLLRLLKPELAPLGNKTGEVLFDGKNTENLTPEESCAIGFVGQSPEHQIVTDKVWHEIVFGMENLRFSQNLMKRRVAEIMSYFGIDSLFDKNTADLSGGQKQMISLSGVLVMNPKVIILDEPTSQLDPVSASEFLTTLKKLNEELGLTIILTEHRLENVIPLCNKLCVIENGKITAFGETRQTVKEITGNDRIAASMPGSVRLYKILGAKGECPLNITEGKKYFRENFRRNNKPFETEESHTDETAAQLRNVYFRYDKDAPDVLHNTSLTVYKNEILCVLGANGSGKTSLLYTLAGLTAPYSGSVEIFGKNIKKYKGQSLYNNCISLLPQDAQTVFLRNTLEEEFKSAGISFEDVPYDLSYATKTHPYDLSGGEQQLAALALVLASKPKILLLDEPTKGLDSLAKQKVRDALSKLKRQGLTVVVVTHDVEFAALCADRAAMFFRGECVCVDTPYRFFSENIFYTTSTARITSGICENLINPEDVSRYAEAGG
ncbi:MAG: ATP-binding cassette domain-containing protein [Clostridia bacterium]|nr:ATP-binding cassette domain-containing protein [Clostridia bacterium]